MRGRGKGFSKLSEVLLVLLVLSVGYLGGVVSTYELSGLDKKTVYNPSYNLTCPKPVRNIDSKVNIDYKPKGRNYIQAAYTDVEYTKDEDEVTVKASSLAKPQGKSMRPTIFSGNTVLLKKYKGGDLDEGQIIRYETDEGFVIHRIQGNYLKSGGYLLMKGDNNDYSSRITKDQVTHKVIGVLYTNEDDSGYSSLQK